MPNPRTKRSPLLLQGEMPSALNPPSGCRFHTRCPYVIDRCRIERPKLLGDAADHATACHRTGELPPADANRSDTHFSPALEQLVAAFSARVEVPAPPGVDIVGARPTAV
jgi:peptide/nickel transport system ATP-binding protein/oligopeptide transport system ATP-binding protein